MSDDAPNWLPTVDDDLTPKPQQDRIITSDEYPMRVLAGAGTGKTFTMIRKIEHLIDSGVSPDRILALTFTNNAADSMREKLNAKLGTAGYDVDAYTYHSICHEILRDYAYDAGLDPDFDILTDAEKSVICLEVLDGIEYRSVKPNVYGSDSFGTSVTSKLRSFIESMKRSGISPTDVDAFLGSPERVYDLDDLPEHVEDIVSEHLGGRSVSTVLDGFPATRAAIAAERDALSGEGAEASVADFLDRFVRLCDALEIAFDEYENGERSLPDNAHKLPKYILGGYSSAPTGIPNDLNFTLTDHLRDFLDECKMARDLNAGYAVYERELDERNLLDFDDLVIETVKLLGTDVGDEIAERWDYVFCDEFQDTDRLQFDLVTSLVSDERLFVVGDDDQAIYEWRGAHVANITDELDAMFGDELADEPLEQNFRSRQPILDLANEALERLDERQSDKTLTRVDEPNYEGETVAVVEEADDEDDRVQQLVTVVRNLLSGGDDALDQAYNPDDIALLVRKNKHASPLLDAFDRAGIPYHVAGDLATKSVGVGTVIAYLKALARPHDDEMSWNRVLTMRYRLSDDDLRRLNTHDDGFLPALLDAPLQLFDEPDRVREAREHVSHLLELRDSVSLAHFYRELTELTDIEWYLSEQERRNLAGLEEVIEQYGDDAIQPPLSAGFIDTLQHYDSLDASGSTPTSDPELADDAINVMTIHKSKGLDFPVVLLPRLTADEWEPSSRTYDALESALTEGPAAAFGEDFVARDARETRRILHVGMTRAEDVLVLHGGVDGDEQDNGQRSIRDAVDDICPSSVAWHPASGHLPIWRDLQECFPPTAVDWTNSLASTVVGDIGGEVTHRSETLSTADGRKRVLSLADRSLDGLLDSSVGSTTLDIDSLTEPSPSGPALQHSYTSLETYESCPRQHYLDYVVNAFTDYQESDNEGDDGISQRDIGLLFHDTAEIATKENAVNPEEWYAICERLAGQRRAHDALDAAKACIDRYFELGLSDWDVIDTEREFELQLDEHELVGFIDAIYRNLEDELVVIDYKATEQHRDIETNQQLPIYLLACRDLYDEPISRAGYAYVGDIGPKMEMRAVDEYELDTVRSTVRTTMAQIAETSFDRYSAGDHCQWCRHNELPCADEWTAGN